MTQAPAGSIFTIAPGLPFVDVLARHLLRLADGDPLRLARVLVLLPNRRAARALKDAFLRHSGGKPLLLPRLKPLEPDADDLAEQDLLAPEGLDLPAPIPPAERQLILTRLVLQMGAGRGGHAPSPDQAARLARELGSLLDSVLIEEIGFDRLDKLVPDDYAAHWQVTIDFLKIVTQHWPALLGGRIDHQDWVNKVLDAQAALWRREPPDYPVVVAGSTGSRPATARLMAAVAGLPHGQVVLPGLDIHMDGESWESLDETHPQYMLKRLLLRLEVPRRLVRDLSPAPDPRAARSALLAEALRPAATCEEWRHPRQFPGALDGVSLLKAPAPREEAGAIALVLRQALEVPERTAALVTPDRDLARRVAAELERWGIAIDDSAGRPLALTEAGSFLRLLARAVTDDFAPHPLLSLVKHPMAAAGLDPARFRAQARRLETAKIVRGPRPAPGLGGLRRACAEDAGLIRWLDAVETALSPFLATMAQDTAPLADLLRTHMEAAEALAADHQGPGPLRLWRGEAGDALARAIGELADALAVVGDMFPPLSPRHYPALFDELLSGRVVRPIWGRHPRLFIWGTMEARLQQADLMILAGLNEGTWPGEAEADPWMSRPMRKAFGLPAPEVRVGQSAHDFTQAFAAPEVMLTRSARVEGTPTVPSRWLMRLDAVTQARGLNFQDQQWEWLAWHALLDRAEERVKVERPAPRPPVAARPRKLSVTEVETWMRDPYGLYAKKVLGLKALDPVDADPGAADYGSLVHEAVEKFLNAYPDALPADAEAKLLQVGAEVFAPALSRPGIWAFWWPRFRAVARWLADHERARRPEIARIHTEIKGALELQGPAGPFLLHARADRVDEMKDGTLALIDYKTGQPPSAKEVAAGYAPQLPLEAAIARFGGFDGVPPAPVSRMLYWRLKGGAEGGEEKTATTDPTRLTDEALEGIQGLIAAFDDPATPYEARPHPDRAPKYSDYLHLARVKEWAVAGEEEGE
ncbi:MAG: double-strand break repair protein AddB [Magnetospirillum sp.]|nr:double-strand break repair protein AddB [Magnetospirillum sp.]